MSNSNHFRIGSTLFNPGGNSITNQPTTLFNTYISGSGVGSSSIANRRAKKNRAAVCCPIPLSFIRFTGTFSIQVTGKSTTLSNLNFLPIIQTDNILNVTTKKTQINANTIRCDIYYVVDTRYSPRYSILDVGVGFSTNAITYYNANIATINFLEFGGIPLYGKGSQFKNLTSNLIFSATDVPLVSPNTSLESAFQSMSNFNQDVTFLNNWNLLNVTTMASMFSGCSAFNNGNTSNLGTKPLSFTTSSALTTVASMFQNCSKFNQTISFSNLDNVTTMASMFSSCAIFNNGNTTDDGTKQLSFTTSPALTRINNMFFSCSKFNQTISFSNLDNVTTMAYMFSGCAIFNNGNTTNEGTASLSFTTSPALTTINNMFQNCYVFNQTISFLNLDNVTTIAVIFYGCSIFNNGDVGGANNGNNCQKPLTFATSNNLLAINNMFQNCVKFNQEVYFNKQNETSIVTGLTTYTSVITGVATFASLFNGCAIFNNGSTTNDGSHPLTFTTSPALKNANGLVTNCYVFNQTVSITNIVNVISLEYFFYNCYIFNNGNTSDDRQKPLLFNTSTALTATHNMFRDCKVFNQTVTISNITKVNLMGSMFSGAILFNNGFAINNTSTPLFLNQKPPGITSAMIGSFGVNSRLANTPSNKPEWMSVSGTTWSVI